MASLMPVEDAIIVVVVRQLVMCSVNVFNLVAMRVRVGSERNGYCSIYCYDVDMSKGS